MLLGLAAFLSAGTLNSAYAQQEPACKKECGKKCDPACKEKCCKDGSSKKCNEKKSCSKETAKA